MATATSASSIALSWTPALGTLSRADGTTLVTVVPNPDGSVPSGSYTDSGLQPGTNYSYSFSPSDTTFAAGSASATTPPVGSAPTPLPTPTPVPPPTGGGGGGGGGGVVPTPTPAPCKITLTADNETAHSIHLKWTQCSDSDFVSYKLYRSSDPNFTPGEGTHLDRGADETQQAKVEYTDSGLAPSTAYTYILVTGHAGTTTQTSTTDSTTDLDTPTIKFDGLARACAGAIGVDGVHSFTITGTASRDDGTGTGNTVLVTGTDFKLSFDANAGSTADKNAKFVTTDSNGNQILVNTLTAHTDDKGTFGVTVRGSDTITSAIKIKVQWTNAKGEDKDAGSQACDFVGEQSLRRYGIKDLNQGYDSDDGWDFDDLALQNEGDSTDATVYIKYQKDPNKDVDTNYFLVNGAPAPSEDTGDGQGGGPDGFVDDQEYAAATVRGRSPHVSVDQQIPLDDDGNWLPVSGHHLRVKIAEIVDVDYGSVSSSDFSNYVTLGSDPSQGLTVVGVTTDGDGKATVHLVAGPWINYCSSIKLQVVDDNQKSPSGVDDSTGWGN